MKKTTLFKSLLAMTIAFAGSKSFADNYVQITSIEELTTGSYVVVGGTSSNAMSTTQAGSSTKPYMAYEAVTIEGDKITDPAASVIWTITKESDNTFSISSNGKYVSSKGAGNYAQLIEAIANTTKYNVTESDNGEFKFACVDPSDRRLQYNANKSQERFACYKGTQKDLLLFKLEVTEEGTTATPSITPLSGTYYTEQEVSMTCETADAKIYYTTNGDVPTAESTPYTTPFKVSTTTTIKAIAIADGLKASSVKEVVLTFPIATEVANIAEFMSTATEGDAVYKITGPVSVVYQDDLNLYIQDASGSLLIYGNISENYNEGDVITGFIGKYGTYQKMTQMIPLYAPTAVSGTPVEPVTMAITDITTADVYKYVKLSEAVFKEDATFETGETTNGIVVSGETEMTIRNNFRVIEGTFEASKKWDIIGLVSVYNGTPQIYPISITEATLDGVKAAATDDNVAIYSSNGKIYINALGGEKIELFSITGQKIAEKIAASGMNVFDAVYEITLVKVGSKVVKVIK